MRHRGQQLLLVCSDFASRESTPRLSIRQQAGSPVVAGARECPPVRKGTRLVPAKRPDFAAGGNTTLRFAGLFVKPSDGLEPSTPSLPWKFRRGTGGHARAFANTFVLQIGQSAYVCSARV
jgi:hypothetical protein